MKNGLIHSAARSSFLSRLIAATAVMFVAFLVFYPHYRQAAAEPALSIPPGTSYGKLWYRVDSLANEGLYRSAKELSGLILEKARKENNQEQIVKALLAAYRMGAYFEERNLEMAIYAEEAELRNLKSPGAQVLHSILAEQYWDYYSNHRWDFSSRTQTSEPVSDSIDTWDLTRLAAKTIGHYQASLAQPDSLMRVPVQKFSSVIVTLDSAHLLRPTLYDFLAHRAISFFSGNEIEATRPAEHFRPDDSLLFADARTFSSHTLNLPAGDTFALRYYALKEYQRLLAFRFGDTARAAYIDADRLRIEFVKDNYSGKNSAALYEKAMRRLAARFPENPYSGLVLFSLAQEYYAQGENYEARNNEEPKWRKRDAHHLCDSIIARFPNSLAAENARMLNARIMMQSIAFIVENNIIPDKPYPGLLRLKNIDSVYFKAVKYDPEKNFKTTREELQYYKGLPAALAWSLHIPSDSDYQQHDVQVAMPALPAGMYMLIACPPGAKDTDTSLFAYDRINVTHIGHYRRAMDEDHDEYLFVNRDNGEPLSNVSAEVLRRKYNSDKGRYEMIYAYTEKSDHNGRVEVSRQKAGTSDYVLDIRWQGEYYRTDWSYWWRNYERDPGAQVSTTFFLDRAIYRPGQIVYFKGIVLEKKGRASKLLTSYKTSVSLYDVNGQQVTNLDLVTNDYGSFSGSFVLPNNGLTGEMHIACEGGSKYFSVEEYKRPKFQVGFGQLREQLVIGDSVRVSGKAMTLAGSPLDQATVRYKVSRIQYDYSWWWDENDNSGETILRESTTTVNDTGGFVFSFKASPGEKSEGMVYYRISIDVTDISGETHSETKSVSLTGNALNISAWTNTDGPLSKTDSLAVTVTNCDGYETEAETEVRIYPVNPVSHFYRTRSWSRPDKFLLAKEEWEKLFPEDPYDNEQEHERKPSGQPVFTAHYKTKTGKQLYLAGADKWKPGEYYAEYEVKDKNGMLSRQGFYFSRYEPKQKKADPGEAYTCRENYLVAEPGQKAVFRFGTVFEKSNLLVEAKSNGKYVYRNWYKTGPEMKEIEIPVTEECRGGLVVVFTMTHNNRSYSFSRHVYVPEKKTKPPVEIVFETFRDKLSPGQKEEWRVKIKGEKGEKVAAEMLAAMYDASLDEFAANSWWFNPESSYYDYYYAWDSELGGVSASSMYNEDYHWYSCKWPEYDYLNWFTQESYTYAWSSGNSFGLNRFGGDPEFTSVSDSVKVTAAGSTSYMVTVTDANASVSSAYSQLMDASAKAELVMKAPMEKMVRMEDGEDVPNATWDFDGKEGGRGPRSVKARKNLGETVFFYPHLLTDADGNIVISFTMNEALSKWKLMTFVHTKDLRYAIETRELVTQKELMIMPNAPRFFREGDRISFTARVANLSGKDLQGEAELQLFDAVTMKPADSLFANFSAKKTFQSAAGKSAALSWDLRIPEGLSAVTYRVVALSGKFSDGEENAVPVLSNRMLVTETLPLSVMSGQNKDYRFEKLISQNGGSNTLRNQKLTLEFTTNPAWYAVQSLPYMMEYPYECAEQTFNRYYANSIAAHIVNSSPKIKAVFESWKGQSPDAFLSSLEKNQELKNLVLSETPWVLEAKNESERKRRVSLLFDANRMADENGRAMRKLLQLQYPNGSWPWFENMPADRFITQYLVCGSGHLDHLGVERSEEEQEAMNKALRWLDKETRGDYDNVLQYDKANKDKDHLGYYQVQYLYARSFYPTVEMDAKEKESYAYYLGQAKKYWTGKNRYMEGMLALVLQRSGDSLTARKLMKSLAETALHSGETGMYWKENTGGWYWYESAVETQSLLIEAFSEVNHDQHAVDEMRTWLLKNKQVNDWGTTKATAEACYALLLGGADWLSTDAGVNIVVGTQKIDPAKQEQQEAGTGYFKTSWSGTEIKPEMGKVAVSKTGPGVSWGAMYWQYFEQIDKITPAQSPLKLSRKLFIQRKTQNGIVLEAVTEKTELHPGDMLKVRVELKNDRDMEYVHLKDMRASGFEPLNVFSQHKYQDGLDYYESTRDAATEFFFAYLPKGTHIFEYPLTVVHAGDFSMGLASAECMYAPEFAAHSEGMRVTVK